MCDLLPWWDRWLGPAFGLSLGLTLATLFMGLLRAKATSSIARIQSAHWSERARVAFEWQRAGMPAYMVCLILLMPMGELESASGCSASGTTLMWMAGPVWLLVLWVLATGFSVAIANAYRGAALSWSERTRSLLALLIIVRPALVPIVLGALASAFAPSGEGLLLLALGVACSIYLFGTGVTYPLACATGVAWPAREAIQRAVQRAAQESGVRLASVDEIAWGMPNALALPLGGRVAFTKAAADALSESEVYAIGMHEVGHLKEPAWARWWRPTQSLVALPLVLAVPLLQADAKGSLLLLGVAAIALWVLNTRLSRHHETHADAHAARAAPDYATALQKIHQLAGVPAVLSKRATHPSLYDRMIAAGVTPDFPRPNAPGGRRALLVSLAIPFAVIFWNAPHWVAPLAVNLLGGSDSVRVALGGTPDDLVALANEVRPANAWFSDQLLGRAVARSGFTILPAVGKSLGMSPCDGLRALVPKLEPEVQSRCTWFLKHCEAGIKPLAQSRRARAR